MGAAVQDYVNRWMNFKAPLDVPSPKFTFNQDLLEKWRAKLQNTKDASLLSQNAHHYIFIYDRLMEGYRDHDKINEFISGSPQAAFTTHNFSLWRKNLGKLSFPIALESRGNREHPGWADIQRTTSWFRDAPPASIGGIVYPISREAFYSLDKHYRNGLHFIRKKVRISIPSTTKTEFNGKQKEYLLKIWAWMYVGRSEHWEDQLDAGMFFSPVDIYEHPLGPYSFFETPLGEPPKEESPPTQKLRICRPFPLVEKNPKTGKEEVVGNGFETEEIEVPVPPNPYQAASMLDGASPVQRTINKEGS